MAYSGLCLFIFVLYTSKLKIFENTIILCLGSNLGPQDWRHRRIHWAIAAALLNYKLWTFYRILLPLRFQHKREFGFRRRWWSKKVKKYKRNNSLKKSFWSCGDDSTKTYARVICKFCETNGFVNSSTAFMFIYVFLKQRFLKE